MTSRFFTVATLSLMLAVAPLVVVVLAEVTLSFQRLRPCRNSCKNAYLLLLGFRMPCST